MARSKPPSANASERPRRNGGAAPASKNGTAVRNDKPQGPVSKPSEGLFITDLQHMTIKELRDTAKKEGLTDYSGLNKQDLLFAILKERCSKNGLMYGEGVLEVLPDGFGFLRSPDYNYLPCPDDIYISPSQIRRFGIKTGSIVQGQIRPPKDSERYFALLRVEAINHEPPENVHDKIPFDELTPLYPEEHIRLETDAKNIDMRIVDLITPIGKGQRPDCIAAPCRKDGPHPEDRPGDRGESPGNQADRAARG